MNSFVDFFDTIISEALKVNPKNPPSDIILKSNVPPAAIVAGQVVSISVQGTVSLDEIKYYLKDSQLEYLNKYGSISFSYVPPSSRNLRYRFHLYKERNSLSCVIRLIPRSIKPLKELNLPSSVSNFVDTERGLLLISGPTGSGKTTTIAAIVNEINQRYYKHIVILEDTIEYIHQNHNSIITYREIGIDSPDYCQALKDVLRMRAHVVVVGEVRTSEEMDVVLSLAESGHFVICSLHAGLGVAHTIERVISLFASEYQDFIRYRLSNVLEGIISMRLFPAYDSEGNLNVFPVCEILVSTPPIKTAIREKKNLVEYMTPDKGMQTFDRAIKELVAKGIMITQNF